MLLLFDVVLYRDPSPPTLNLSHFVFHLSSSHTVPHLFSPPFPSRPHPTHTHTQDEDTAELKNPTVFHCGDGDFVAEDVCYITDEETASFKRIAKDEKEIWQVVVRKLRCWVGASADGKGSTEPVPCRPYCILVNCLYPNSQVCV
jgi:hypothetical protein